MCPTHSRTTRLREPPLVIRSAGSRTCPEPVFSTREVGGFVLSEGRYEPGYRGDVHRHPAAYFVYVANGGFVESCSSGCVPYSRGTLHFHTSDDPHAGAVGELGAHCFNITPNEPLGNQLESDIGNRRNEEWPKLIASLAARCHHGFMARDPASDLECEGAALELMAAALRLASPRESAAPRWLFVARDYLHAHATEQVTLTQLSEVSGVHRIHFARTFRRVWGVTPAEYVRRLRLESACGALVETDQPIADIALDCGYSSQAHFTRAFGAHIGETPGAYRRARRNRLVLVGPR
jgi:AraC-like DNA-binding protein